MINFYNTPEKQQKLMKAVYKAALKHFSQPDIFSVEIEIVSAEYGHSEEREAAYLTLHGILHLLGFDHIEDADRALMRKHEEEILNSLGITRD